MQKPFSIACIMVATCILSVAVVPAGPDTAGAQDGLLTMVKQKKPSLPGPDPFDEKLPAKGKFLVASPNLSDPRFRETVVLLIDYGTGGATGLIINRPTRVRLAELFPDEPGMKERADIVYYGGPVEGRQMLMLIRAGEKPEESVRVFGDVYVSTSKNTLERMVRSHKPDKQLRLYAGYAGWMPGQLNGEVGRGDWLIVRADAQSIFESDASGIWDELIQRGSVIQVLNRDVQSWD